MRRERRRNFAGPGRRRSSDGAPDRRQGRHPHPTRDVPVTLVHDIDLAIGGNEFVAITGPSGSGKSSLLYLLGLLDLPTAGEVQIRQRATVRMDEAERASIRLSTIGFVFQFHFLLPSFQHWTT